MFRKILFHVLGIMLASTTLSALANPGQPNFMPSLYGDGEVWGTKGTTTLPAPNEHNRQSFDVLYVITNSNNPQGQLPVSEAAPGNPSYWASGAHAPNEHVRLGDLLRAVRFNCHLFARLAQ